MVWEPTDQFGNLYIGTVSATSAEDLRPALASMFEELLHRCDGDVIFTLDPDYGEINGPHPENVSHVLRSDWFGSGALASEDMRASVAAIVGEVSVESGRKVSVNLA